MTHDELVATHFPYVDPGREPLGNKILVQLMLVPKKKGSIILATETQDFNKNSTVVCRVIKAGQIAYRDRSSGFLWKEGAWCIIGDIVLMPRYGGCNRVEIPLTDEPDQTVIFCTYNDYEVVDKVTGQYEQYLKLI